MAVEVWVAAFGSTTGGAGSPTANSLQPIYRFNASSGAPMSGTNPNAAANAYLTRHGGTLIPAGTAVVIAPAGQTIYKLNGTGVSTVINGPSQSGNVVAAGGPEMLHDFVRPPRKTIYVAAGAGGLAELWSWDGQTGICQTFLLSSGALLTTYQLAAGSDIAYVTTA